MIAPARRAAYRILLEVAAGDAHSDELLRSPEVDALSAQDRNLTTALVLGTLRWQLALDARILPLLARPGAKLAPEVAAVLRLGTFQLLYMDRLPAHAVIHDSVELIKQSRERGAAGMVNAVLRKIPGGPRPGLAASATTPAEIAAAWAHPAWMVARWAGRYGLEAAEAICRWDQQPAGISIRLVDPAAHLAEIESAPGTFLAQARHILRGDVSRSPALRAGQVRIQDEASQLVGEIAAAAAPGAARVLDTCAAPGGKTAILAERFPSAAITAVDISRRRLEAMREFLGRWGENLRYEIADAAMFRPDPAYGLILCDVPCSGTGTIARNPEIRFRIDEGELTRQQKRQRAILRSSLAGLAPGGRLVYSTCSLEPEENEAVIEQALRTVAGVKVIPVAGMLDRLAEQGIITAEGRERLRGATEGSFLRTLPGVQPCDGFFAAVLEIS